ncbi:MAG: hypothetical protein ABI882_21240 [Acidobacteriota bacterium]
MPSISALTKNHTGRFVRRCFAFAIAGALVIVALLSPVSPIRAVSAAPGDLDLSFAQDGQVELTSAAFSASSGLIAMQPDGKMVVAFARNIKGLDQITFLHVRRYLPNGEVDWQRDVSYTTAQLTVRKALVRPDGKILIAYWLGAAGDTTGRVMLLDSSGSLDTSFGTNGRVRSGLFRDVAAMPDNRLITLEATQFKAFDAGGILVQTVNLLYPRGDDNGRWLAVGPDGRLVVASTFSALNRYNSDLTPDGSFCGGGPCFALVPQTGRIAIGIDNKIVVTSPGGPNSSFLVTRQLADGSVDTSFGASGVLAYGDNHFLTQIVVDDNGGIVVLFFQGTGTPGMIAINASGSNVATLNAPIGFINSSGLLLQHDGKLLAAGQVGIGQSVLQRFHYDDESRAADLSIDTIGITPTRVVHPGDEITFDMRVNNNGKSNAGYLTFQNPLPTGTTFVSLGAPNGWVTYQEPRFIFGKVSSSGYSLAAGQSVTFRLKLRVNTFPHVSQVSNTATISGLVSDQAPSNNTTSATVRVQ